MVQQPIKPLFPLFLKLEGKKCIVIGGGRVGSRKVRDLLSSGAEVTVLSPEITPELEALAAGNKITLEKKMYTAGDLKGAFLVIDATGDNEVAVQVIDEVRASSALLNVVDKPEQCDFYVPSVHRQGHLTLAASSNGMSPALVKRIRKQWQVEFGQEYAVYLNACEKIRHELRDRYPEDAGKRMEILRQIAESDILETCKGETEDIILEKMRSWIS